MAENRTMVDGRDLTLQCATAVLKDEPYIWVTWLTRLIAGEAQCEWSLWYRARYRFDKLAPGSDLVRWTMEHDHLVQARAEALVKAGLKPVPEQSMTVRGRLATVSGNLTFITSSEARRSSKTARRIAARFRPRSGLTLRVAASAAARRLLLWPRRLRERSCCR